MDIQRTIDRLKNRDEAGGTVYELLTAERYKSTNIGCVEFVPTAKDSRRPDLVVSRGEQSVWIECQYKDRFKPAPLSYTYLAKINERCEEIKELGVPGIDVWIMVVGNDEQTIDETLSIASEGVSTVKRGEYYFPKLGASIKIAEMDDPPQLPFGNTIDSGAFAPPIFAGCPAGSASTILTVNDDGSCVASNPRRIQVFPMDSHSFKSILNSFNTKRQRKQVPQGGVVVFHFDLDLSHIHPSNYDRYLLLAGNLLARQAWSTGANERIGGFMITGWPFIMERGKNGYTFLEAAMGHGFWPRDNHTLPAWFQLNKN